MSDHPLVPSADGSELLTREEVVGLGPAFFDQRIADALAMYQRAVSEANEAQRRLTAIRVSKTSKKRELTVTVDARGRLLEAKFAGQAHRELTAIELSRLVTETVGAAQVEALREAKGVASTLRPPRPRPDLDAVFEGGFPSYDPAPGDGADDRQS